MILMELDRAVAKSVKNLSKWSNAQRQVLLKAVRRIARRCVSLMLKRKLKGFIIHLRC